VIRTPESGGAGFYVTPETVVTNAHVVGEHRFVEVRLRDGRDSFGRVMAADPYTDLAIIRTEARGVPAKLAGVEPPMVGSTIDLIGHPKGLQFSLSRGVVSATRRQRISSLPGAGAVLVVQTDAAASPGNSGGPWFQQGEVVAVTSYKRRDGESLNFGVHVSELREFLRKHGVEVP
jgi:serine protease Do